jgi:hypothetical protein
VAGVEPAFASGGRVDELVADGLLHPECERIFRPKRTIEDAGQAPITLHRHQRDAVEVARTGSSYVLTTGTGSGKSLAYIAPIVDRVLREGSGGGIKAVVVYPMNALANSQREEQAKFLAHGYGEGDEPVTFARYTGQEDDETRRQVLSSPPDILLTNYVMLELMLTRPEERGCWSGQPRAFVSWCSTSCTPTAGARAPDSPLGLAIPGSGSKSRPRNALYLSGRGALGRWLKHPEPFGVPLSVDDGSNVIEALLAFLGVPARRAPSRRDGIGERGGSAASAHGPGVGSLPRNCPETETTPVVGGRP